MPEIVFRAEQGSGVKRILRLMRGDARTHVVKFIVARYYGGVDLAALAWYVHYFDAAGVEQIALPEALYEVTADEIYIRWMLDSLVTADVGNVQFELHGVGKDADENPVYWKSRRSEIEVLDTFADIEISEEQNQALSALDELIVYVQGELPTVLDARDAATQAAAAALEAGGTVDKVVEKFAQPNVTVETLAAGANATAAWTGAGDVPTLALGIPRGPQGETGPAGPKGDAGLPEGGVPGDMLVRTQDSAEWVTPATDDDIVDALLAADLLPAVMVSGAVLRDGTGKIVLI